MAQVKFKVTDFADQRAANSSLEIGNIYEGDYRVSNNSIWWRDPQNEQEWIFWVGDTCELVDSQEQIVKELYQLARKQLENVGIVTTSIED